jgi:putative peptide zinc metalloprotease protein
MNLIRVLNVALPDLPARVVAERPPRLDPGVNFREHIEDGKPVVRVYVPSVGNMFTFPPANWKLAQLFDGNRTYEEIAELHSQQIGSEYSAEDVRDVAAQLEALDFWYKTPQEKNILLMQQSVEERKRKLKQQDRWADLSDVLFPAFNPDPFLTKFHSYTHFIYTPWFTILTLIAFAAAAGITVTHWSEIGRDTVEFYKFSNKSWGDLVVMYILVFAVVVVHEFAHAYTSKHFGGRVTAMGFALVYLTPAFYTDTTEAEVTTTRSERLLVTLAGVWSELMICAVATFIWWGTPPNTALHNSAYFLMMLTGIVSVLLNWNPLMKLDGYYLLCGFTGIATIKEDSTAYVAAWVKKRIWRLPVEVPYVPKRRRLPYAAYALVSGVYSYTVLYVVAGFVGNIVRSFSPEWGFIPEIAVALMIFRSRIRLLVNFMKFLYLDKKDRVQEWFTPRRSLAVVAVIAFLVFVPMRRESVSGKFLLEPAHEAVIHAHVAGIITGLHAEEGQRIAAGSVLASLRNLPLQSDVDAARANFVTASSHASGASLRYADLGTALKERERSDAALKQISDKNASLQVTSPIGGTVITPRVQDLAGSYVTEGQELLTVADLSSLRARIYISEYDLDKIGKDAKTRLQIDGQLGTMPARTAAVAIRPVEIDPRLSGKVQYQGMNPPHFYLVDLVVENAEGRLKPGMSGVARVYGQRRSMASVGWEEITNFWERKIW